MIPISNYIFESVKVGNTAFIASNVTFAIRYFSSQSFRNAQSSEELCIDLHPGIQVDIEKLSSEKLAVKKSKLLPTNFILTQKEVILTYFQRTCFLPPMMWDKRVILEDHYPHVCSLIKPYLGRDVSSLIFFRTLYSLNVNNSPFQNHFTVMAKKSETFLAMTNFH